MAKQRRSFLGTILGFILFLAIVYIALAVLDFLGVFVLGTYKDEAGVITSELKFNGETADEKVTYRVYGNEIYFYSDGEETAKGIIQNGVISLEVVGELSANLYKDGNAERDPKILSFVDYLRGILKPATQLIGKIVD